MPTLLHIDTSASPYSISRQLADRFVTTWTEQTEDSHVIHHDLVENPVPHLDQAGVKTLIAPAENEAEEAAAALHETLSEEVLAADVIVISAPMYNWNIPSNLKAWFDQILIMGRTLPFDPSMNPLAGRPAHVFLAYGGDYSPGSEDSALDHCGPYLQTVLGTVLGYDVNIVTVQETLAPMTSEDPAVHEKAAVALEAGLSRAAESAGALAGALLPA